MYPKINRLVEVIDLPPGKSYFNARLTHPGVDEEPTLEVPRRKVRFGCDPKGVIHAKLIGEDTPAVGDSVWISFEGTSLIGWGTTESFLKAKDLEHLTVKERRQAFGLDVEPRDDPRPLCA